MGHRNPAYLQRVRDLGCLVCSEVLGIEDTPAAAHHLFDPKDRDDYLTAPLCREHHQGKTGFHGLGGAEPFRRLYNLSECELLALTLARLDRGR